MIGAAGILLIILAVIFYRNITPQDRFFIGLEESDIETIILCCDRAGKEPVELTGSERQEVVGQLLRVELKGGWTVMEVLNGGTTEQYHIVLSDGREFDFGALTYHKTRPNGTLKAHSYYIINGIRAYKASKKESALIEQIDETWRALTDKYYPRNW